MSYQKIIQENPDLDVNLDKNIDLPEFIWGDTNDLEKIKLLCKLGYNKNVFELGTYRGRTTYILSQYAKHVTTFDLGSNISLESKLYSNYDVGEIYKKNNCTNVTQLIGNSLEFDFTPHYEKFDLVYLDGGHTYDIVKNDFEVSFNLLKPGGWIIVDDMGWSEVKQAMMDLTSSYNIEFLNDIAYYKK
jgi:predicted O-methyltransferase YrrM